MNLNPFARLDELTRIKNDFEDEIVRHRNGSDRRNQLNDDHKQVFGARGDEIGKLMKSGHTEAELRAHLDANDPHRNR
jgi:hypothetical protein